jgi:ABC-type glycerol-3-phosphate transport system substrate-binding protein
LKTLKKIAAAAIAAGMLITTFAACGKSAVKLADTNYIFRTQEVILEGDYDYVNNSVYKDGKIYLLAQASETKIVPMPHIEAGDVEVPAVPAPITPLMVETAVVDAVEYTEDASGQLIASDGTPIPDGYQEIYISKNVIAVLDENGKKISEKTLSTTENQETTNENSWYNSIQLLSDGSIVAFKNTAIDSYDADGNYTGTNTNLLVTFDDQLNESTFFDFSAAMKKIPASEGIDEYVTPNAFAVDNAGNIYILTYQGVYVFNKQSSQYLFGIKQSDGSGQISEYFNNLLNIGGQVGVVTQVYENTPDDYKQTSYIKIIDPAQKGFGTVYNLENANYNLQPGNSDYPFIMINGAQLFAFDVVSGERTLLIDFLASGMAMNNYNNILILGNNRYATIETYWEENTGMTRNSKPTTKMTIFTKVDPAEVGKRELVTIYTFYQDYRLTEFAADFNKTNTQYQIALKAYIDDYSADTADVIARLNNDILSGNIPDILMLDSNMPFDSYAAKGLFWDLNKYLDKDEELKKDSMNESVLSALSTDGKLYSLTKEFYVRGLAGKKSIFGNANKLTADLMSSALANYPDSQLMGRMVRESFISNMVGSQINSFVDKTTGKVSFNTPEFIELLNIAKTYPANLDNENFDYSYYDDMYRANKALLSTMYLYNFRTLNDSRYREFGEEITFMGYPGSTGSGIMMTPGTELSIMSRGNRDAAWEVLKAYMLLEDENGGYNFSIFNEDNDKLAAEAKVPQTFTDSWTGEVIVQPNTYYANGEEHTYPDNTEADNQVILDIIANIEGVSRGDIELMKIIEEETAAFFAGSKTAEECAALIEDRASTYVAETR